MTITLDTLIWSHVVGGINRAERGAAPLGLSAGGIMGKGSDLVRLWPIEKDCRTGDLTVAQGPSSSDVEADLDDDHDETAVTHAELPS